MSKVWFRLLLTLAFLQAFVAHASLTLEVGQRSGTPGAVLLLPITLSHDTSAVGLMVDINYDATVMSLTLPENVQASAHLMRAGSPTAGHLRLVVVPTTAAFETLPQGTLLNLQLTILANAPNGTYPIELVNLQASDTSGTPIHDTNLLAGLLDIRGANQAPQAALASFVLQEDTPFAGFLQASDGDGDPLVYSIQIPPTAGTVMLTNAMTGAFTYVPNLNAEGRDQFEFAVNDGMATSTPATIELTIQSVNDAPSAAIAYLEAQEDQATTATPTVSDVDVNDTHTFAIIIGPNHGVADITGDQLRYTPQADFFGSDQFTFLATDQGDLSVQGVASVEVTPVNDAPSSVVASFDLLEDVPQTLQPMVEDIDSDNFTFALITPPQHGAIAIDGNSLTFTPTPNFNGTDAFVLRTFDNQLAFLDTQINVVVNAVNDPPTSATLQMIVCSEQESNAATPTVTDVDLDYEGDQYTFELLSQPSSGSVTLIGDAFFYISDVGFLGTDTFEFNATDTSGASVTGIAQVEVVTLNQVSIAGSRAQGLEPLVFAADTNCGVENALFSWFELESGTLIGTGPDFVLSPAPTETTAYELIAEAVGDQTEVSKTFHVLVHPQGVDLNHDGINDLADLMLAAQDWRLVDSVFEADGRFGLTILDLLYINTGSP